LFEIFLKALVFNTEDTEEFNWGNQSAMAESANLAYEFDSFRLIPAERQLLRNDKPVPLPRKAFDTLVVLVQNSGHALKKDDLMKQVWPDSFVEESNLNHNISVLRKALSVGNNGDGYVETVRGYGFRFKANVCTSPPEESAVLLQRRTHTHVVVKEEQLESLSTVSSRQTAGGRSTTSRFVVMLAFIVLVGGIVAAYFGYIRPERLKNAQATSTAPPIRTKPAENPAAREAYLKGRYFWNKRTRDDILKAEQEFQNALTIDPNYARAYAGLADCLLLGGATPAFPDSAKDFALKALSIDDSIAEAHTSLAYYLSAVDWKWEEAEVEFQRAILLDPGYATARHWHAYNLASLGRTDEAVSEIKKAESIDPVSVIIKTDVGHMLYFAGRFDEAIAQYLKALAINSEFRVARWRLGEAYLQVDRYDEGISELQKAVSLDSEKQSQIEVWIACAYAAANRRDQALKILNRLKPEAEWRRQTFYMALIYVALGDNDSAFIWLKKSLQFREGTLALLKVEPMLKNLRDDARYAELLRRMNLPTS